MMAEEPVSASFFSDIEKRHKPGGTEVSTLMIARFRPVKVDGSDQSPVECELKTGSKTMQHWEARLKKIEKDVVLIKHVDISTSEGYSRPSAWLTTKTQLARARTDPSAKGSRGASAEGRAEDRAAAVSADSRGSVGHRTPLAAPGVALSRQGMFGQPERPSVRRRPDDDAMLGEEEALEPLGMRLRGLSSSRLSNEVEVQPPVGRAPFRPPHSWKDLRDCCVQSCTQLLVLTPEQSETLGKTLDEFIYESLGSAGTI